MQPFDIIVIGAGPAGSAAACWAARHGASVALVDKASFPRDKLCGGLFTERSHRYYREIFDQELDFSRIVSRKNIEFWQDGTRLARVTDVPPLHLTMRLNLDNQLFSQTIAAGAQDFSGQAISEVASNAVHFRNGTVIEGRILIGADGVNSIVARHLFGTPFDKDTIGFGLEIEAKSEDRSPDLHPLRIDFGAADWGYGWAFPKVGSTTIGIGGLHAENTDMKAKFAAYLDRLGLTSDANRIKGHYLPFGDFRTTPGRGNILLAGDAAGLVDPITGEGIAFAMKSGQLAAKAALEALARDTPDDALPLYKEQLKTIHRNLRIARTLRRIVFAPRWQSTLSRSFRRSGTVRLQYMRLLAGEIEYPELARRVLLRLPRYLLTALRR
ncbi:geranylgeranyl reductase family protein [uncultured Shimia sp.]|uniref:geranylgeranyl reductase family protein n=1 Tax=uncultured Shimia sp. TaxID=573152 RepID=UPI002638221B|nr:geranylgeranyl reductase family protein [uncultured Shimia sp.]